MEYTIWLNQIDKGDTSIVGGKAANLGELKRIGCPVPDGFVVTSQTFSEFVNRNNLQTQIENILQKADFQNAELIEELSKHVKSVIRSASIPEEISREIKKSYSRLSKNKGFVAVRSSATVEDVAITSFAGQLESFTNLNTEEQVLESIKKCWASFFAPRTLFYANERKIDLSKIGVAAMVQEMVESDVSGVMFTVDPITNNKDRVIIEAILGLGEMIVSGSVTPDKYELAKQSLTIIGRSVGNQAKQLILSEDKNKEISVSTAHRETQKISDEKLIELAKLGKKIESSYLAPQDIEWAMVDAKIFILQSRPVTSITLGRDVDQSNKSLDLPTLIKGTPASPGLAQGIARVVPSAKDLKKVRNGDVLVIPASNQSYVTTVKKASAVVMDKGGETSHAAIVSRELGIPCVVGTGISTKKIKSGMAVTVNGTLGTVYEGSIPRKTLRYLEAGFRNVKNSLAETEKKETATKVYASLFDATLSSEISQKQVDGVGLLRAEFIFSEVGIHPKKLIAAKREKLLKDKLFESLKIVCASFDPRPVIYRSANFTTSEYLEFEGGKGYEHPGVNPAVGFRGAIRAIHDPEIFNLELEVIKKVRDIQNLKNLWLAVPFVRTAEELAEVKRLISASGLHRSSSFKLILSAEIPSNAALIEDFLEVGIDGVSIDLVHLTNHMLGIDLANENIAQYYSNPDKTILWALERIIKECNRKKLVSNLVGQGSLIHTGLLEKVIEWGVTSVSVSADSIEEVRSKIHDLERKLVSVRKKQ